MKLTLVFVVVALAATHAHAQCYRLVNGVVPRDMLSAHALNVANVNDFALVDANNGALSPVGVGEIGEYVDAVSGSDVLVEFADCVVGAMNPGTAVACPSMTVALPVSATTTSFYTVYVFNTDDVTTVAELVEDNVTPNTDVEARITVLYLVAGAPVSGSDIVLSARDATTGTLTEVVTWPDSLQGDVFTVGNFSNIEAALSWEQNEDTELFFRNGRAYSLLVYGDATYPSSTVAVVRRNANPGVVNIPASLLPTIDDLCDGVTCAGGRECRNGRCIATDTDELCRSYLGFDITEVARDTLNSVDHSIIEQIHQLTDNLRDLRDAVLAYDPSADNQSVNLTDYVVALSSVCQGRDESRCNYDACALALAGEQSSCSAAECMVPAQCVPLSELEFLQSVFLGAVAKLTGDDASMTCLDHYHSDIGTPNPLPDVASVV